MRTESSSATIGLVIELPPTNIFGQSLGLADQSLRLTYVARKLRRQSVWSRASGRRPIYGASDIGQTSVTAVIQAKIAAGRPYVVAPFGVVKIYHGSAGVRVYQRGARRRATVAEATTLP